MRINKNWKILCVSFLVFCLVIFIRDVKNILNIYDKQLDSLGKSYGIGIQKCADKLKDTNEKYLQCNGFRQVLFEAKQEVYNRATNNCYMQSKRMQSELLSKYGIISSIFINKNRNHAWLGVWVEATSGEFVPANNTLEMIEVRDSKQNVILSDPRFIDVPVSTATFPILWQR